ncbi:MAG: Ig-like domain-containing protein [Ruminococcus sp.]|nr:Ig-like domain-containing protein [Ruminococcus sp.]
MKTEKITASIMAATLGLSTVIPVGFNTNAILISETSINKQTFYADKTYSLGDINGDNIVDAADASCVLSEYSILSTSGKYTFTEKQKLAADTNKDSFIDANDASEILAYYSYLSTGGKILDMQEYINYMQNPQQSTTTTSITTAKTTTSTTTTTTLDSTTSDNAQTTSSTTKNTTSSTTESDTITTTTAISSTSSATTSITTTVTTETTTITTTATTNPDKVSAIRISQTELVLNVGNGALAANVTMLPSTALNKSEIWTSSDKNIATVDDEGWVIGKSEGTCIITVKSEDNPEISAEITVNVTDTSLVKDIRLSRTSFMLKTGYGELSANVTMLPVTAVNKDEIWTSSDEKIATVDNEGWVIGKSAGTCIITVKSVSNPDISAQIEVIVYDNEPPVTTTTTTTTTTETTTTTTTGNTIRVTEIKTTENDIEMIVGENKTAYITMLPENATNKNEIWTSSDENIAVVDGQGRITALKEGVCVITVKSEDNPDVKMNIVVTVTNPNKVTQICLSKYEMTIGVGNKDLSWVTMLPSTALNKNEIWKSSDENIATVDEFGWVYGKSIGECTVTVYSEDNPTVKAEIAVKVVDPSNAPTPNPGDSMLFSRLATNESDSKNTALYTPFPKNASGRFIIDYIITDANGKTITLSSNTLLVPEVNSVTTPLTAETSNFTVTSYLTNLNTNKRIVIGTYEICSDPRYAKTVSENIYNAFYSLDGIITE